MNISAISMRLGISPHTLRYYEKIGLIRNVARNSSGKRVYSEKDYDWIVFLLKLKRVRMPIQEIMRYAKLRYQGNETADERRQLLINQREKLLRQIDELTESVDFIEQKIEYYNRLIK